MESRYKKCIESRKKAAKMLLHVSWLVGPQTIRLIFAEFRGEKVGGKVLLIWV